MAAKNVDVDCMKMNCRWNKEAKCAAARVLVGDSLECMTFEEKPPEVPQPALGLAGGPPLGGPIGAGPALPPPAGGRAIAPRPLGLPPAGPTPAPSPGAGGLAAILSGIGGRRP